MGKWSEMIGYYDKKDQIDLENIDLKMDIADIAEIVECKVSVVYETIEKLSYLGLISIPSLMEVENQTGQNNQAYYVTERDSYVILSNINHHLIPLLICYWDGDDNGLDIDDCEFPRTYSAALRLCNEIAGENKRLRSVVKKQMQFINNDLPELVNNQHKQITMH